MIQDFHPGSGSWFFAHPGSRIQGSKRRRIPDPQHLPAYTPGNPHIRFFRNTCPFPWVVTRQALLNMNFCLKGQCHEIFCFWFFSWISFPQALEYTVRAVSNSFENSRRYSQLKVDHLCQRRRWQICHRCQRYRRQICPRCQRHRWQLATGINDTGGKFATGVSDTSGKQWD